MRQVQRGPLPPGPERRDFLEQQPTYWLKRCYQALRRTVDAELRQYGITLSQRDVLLALWEEGPMDQRTLLDRLGLEQSSVSRLVDGLARRGLVALDGSPVDRRVRVAALTEQGIETLLGAPGTSEIAGETMLSGLSSNESKELVRLLRHCAQQLAPGSDEARAVRSSRVHRGADNDATTRILSAEG